MKQVVVGSRVCRRPLAALLAVALLVAGAALVAAAPTQTPAAALRYEPAVVTLTGTLFLRTFPGPPNYEDVKKGDEPERVWLLRLSRPVRVVADRAHDLDDDNETENNVSVVQPVLTPEQMARCRHLAARRRPVTMTGTLFHSITGHHHSAVLITVSRLSETCAPGYSRPGRK